MSANSSGNPPYLVTDESSIATPKPIHTSVAEVNTNKNGLIAIGQLCSTNDVDQNFKACEEVVTRAVAHGCKLVCLPENFAFLGEQSTDVLKIASGLDGNLFQQYRQLAKQKGVWLSCGGFHESTQDPTHVYNSHVIVDNNGDIKAVYRKLHLFRCQVKGQPGFDEAAVVTQGNEIVVVDSPVGKLGLSTCYDVRFPELYTTLRNNGAEVILVPSAFTLMTGKDHWEVLMRARAIETQCYVVAAAQSGIHNARRTSFGRSMIVDPWGVVTTCCTDSAPVMALGEIDHMRIHNVRQSMPVFEHRRNDIFSATPKITLL